MDDPVYIKVYACWPGETSKQLYQLSANGPEEYRALLKRLELLADFLPYLTQAEQAAKDKNDDFEWGIKLDNLKSAIGLLA